MEQPEVTTDAMPLTLTHPHLPAANPSGTVVDSPPACMASPETPPSCPTGPLCSPQPALRPCLLAGLPEQREASTDRPLTGQKSRVERGRGWGHLTQGKVVFGQHLAMPEAWPQPPLSGATWSFYWGQAACCAPYVRRNCCPLSR